MVDWKDIAELVYPDIHETIEDLEERYPPRSRLICSRIAPSPTGFLHIGAVFAALAPYKFAKQNHGTFILRIEDTDQKRQVEGSINQMIDLLKFFEIEIDEGPLGPDTSDVGNYGPYIQSHRKLLYHVFVKDLIARGLAYPCWMAEEEIDAIRQQQTKTKVAPGIYGNYSLRRNKSTEEIMQKIQQDPKYIIRFRSHGDITKRIVFEDVIKGKINMTDNFNDIVLIKSNGLPTYHMAHVVDDHLMRVSHVIRAEEWLMSVPLHLQLFQACQFIPPLYCHVAQILKLDEGKKRKISKRKDPEANVEFFFEHGYAKQGIISYLFNLIDSGFEDWQKANPDKDYRDFEIVLEHMNTVGALFDLVKLQSVNNAYLSRISTQELFDQTLEWAKKYKADLAGLLESDSDYAQAAINIERHTLKDPKRFSTFLDVDQQIRCFFDSERERLQSSKPAFPQMITLEIIKSFVNDYEQALNLDMSVEERFAQLKEIGKAHGFAPDNAEFKAGKYIGKVGDLAMLLRSQLCCSAKSPDLYSVMKVMGKKRVIDRLKKLY